MCMSLIDIEITGILLDGAGNNRRFVRNLLTKERTLMDGRLKRTSCTNVYLGHPHEIFVWYCSTHNVKSLCSLLVVKKKLPEYTMMWIMFHLDGRGLRVNGIEKWRGLKNNNLH